MEQIMAEANGAVLETCGLLLGRDGAIDAILPAANVAADPARHFELDPAVLLRAHRAARLGGAPLLGHYHSHPSGVARPSATDAACATPDGSLWLIVAGSTARLWRADGGEGGGVVFRELELVLCGVDA